MRRLHLTEENIKKTKEIQDRVATGSLAALEQERLALEARQLLARKRAEAKQLKQNN